MRVRAIYVAVFVLLTIAGLMVYGALGKRSPAPSPAEPAGLPEPDEFLEKAREQAGKESPKAEDATAMLPPAGTDAATAPIIELEPSLLLDMGVIPRENPPAKTVKVYNKGKSPLAISRVTTTCSCTRVTIDDKSKSILPGQFGMILVSVIPEKVPGFTSRKTLTVYSNDPARPETKMDVLAKIDPEFLLDPETLDFGEVRKGQAVVKRLLVRQLTDSPLEITEIKPLTEAMGMTVVLEKRPESEWVKPGHVEYWIAVQLREDVPSGAYSGWFNIKTNCPRVPQYTYPVKADVKTFYTLAPARVLMVRTDPHPGQKSSAKVTISAEEPIEIVEAATSTPDLTVTTAPGTEPNTMGLEVAVKPEATGGHRTESVQFVVKSARERAKEKLTVNVFAAQPEKAASK